MIQTSARLFFKITALLELARVVSEDTESSRVATGEDLLGTLNSILDLCKETDLSLSIMYINQMTENINAGEYTFNRYGRELTILKGRIEDELDSVRFLRIPPHQTELYKDVPQFGDEAATKFSKVTSDIQEAAKCLALGRTTASVFHLMRVMEHATQYLGKRLNINLVSEKNWHNILDEVDKAIKNLPAKNSRQKAIRNKYAETSAHLRMVKDAWRNDVMHPKETYTEEEAERVFRNVKDFIVHLATKL